MSDLPSKQFVEIETFKNFITKIENLLEDMILADMDTLNSYNNKSLTLTLLKKGYSKKIISKFSFACSGDFDKFTIMPKLFIL